LLFFPWGGGKGGHGPTDLFFLFGKKGEKFPPLLQLFCMKKENLYRIHDEGGGKRGGGIPARYGSTRLQGNPEEKRGKECMSVAKLRRGRKSASFKLVEGFGRKREHERKGTRGRSASREGGKKGSETPLLVRKGGCNFPGGGKKREEREKVARLRSETGGKKGEKAFSGLKRFRARLFHGRGKREEFKCASS